MAGAGYGSAAFFLSGCKNPGDPGLPIGAFGFFGLIEFCYLDVFHPDGSHGVNPAVVKKEQIENIQEERLYSGVGSDGNNHFARGYSGWYFQAMASTSDVKLNNTQQDERDLQGHMAWGDPLAYWWNQTPMPSPNFGPLERIFMGPTRFGSLTVGVTSDDPNDPVGTILTDVGPIRLTYAYGQPSKVGSTQNLIRHRLQMELVSTCKAKLMGELPEIEDWQNNAGGMIPDTDEARFRLSAGADSLIVLDPLRGVRIRVMGWLGHYADHLVKNNDRYENFTFPAGLNFIYRDNSAAYANDPDSGAPLGDFTPLYSTDTNGTTTYLPQFEFTGFHQKYLGDWINANGQIQRDGLKGKALIWNRLDENGDPLAAMPDPYRVLLEGGKYHQADEVVESLSSIRKTVHTPPTGAPFYDPPDYADNAGFVFHTGATSDKWGYVHVSYGTGAGGVYAANYYGGKTQPSPVDLFDNRENYGNAILWNKGPEDWLCDNLQASVSGLVFAGYGITGETLPELYSGLWDRAGSVLTFRLIYHVKGLSTPDLRVNFGDGSADLVIPNAAKPYEYSHDYGVWTGSARVTVRVEEGGKIWNSAVWVKI